MFRSREAEAAGPFAPVGIADPELILGAETPSQVGEIAVKALGSLDVVEARRPCAVEDLLDSKSMDVENTQGVLAQDIRGGFDLLLGPLDHLGVVQPGGRSEQEGRRDGNDGEEGTQEARRAGGATFNVSGLCASPQGAS